MNWTTLKTGAAVIAAAVATGIAVHMVNQNEIAALREEQQQLADARGDLIAERDAALAEAEASAGSSDLSQQERSELLRLRGEVTRLRRNQTDLADLQQQNQALQQELADTRQAEAAAEAEEAARQAVVQRLNDSKQLVLGVLLYANDNDQQLPENLAMTSTYWGDAATAQRLSNSGFELVGSGSYASIADPSTTIVVRERVPQWVNGKRTKVYGFLDGHSESLAEPPEGFEAWERQRMAAWQQGQ